MSLELLGAEYVEPQDLLGFDWMDIVKGAAGALSNAGKMMSGGGTGSAGAQAAALERRRLEEERQKAEERAARLKMGLGIITGIAGVVIAGLIIRGR